MSSAQAGFDALIEKLTCEGLQSVKPLLPAPEFGQDVALVAFLIDDLRKRVAAKDEELFKANEKVEAFRAEAERFKGFEDAIIDACVVGWIYTKEHETNPRKAINDLLAWQQQIALDPAVSKPAAKLHEEIADLRAEVKRLQRIIDEENQPPR